MQKCMQPELIGASSSAQVGHVPAEPSVPELVGEAASDADTEPGEPAGLPSPSKKQRTSDFHV